MTPVIGCSTTMSASRNGRWAISWIIPALGYMPPAPGHGYTSP
jgi:hypothetical protein